MFAVISNANFGNAYFPTNNKLFNTILIEVSLIVISIEFKIKYTAAMCVRERIVFVLYYEIILCLQCIQRGHQILCRLLLFGIMLLLFSLFVMYLTFHWRHHYNMIE